MFRLLWAAVTLPFRALRWLFRPYVLLGRKLLALDSPFPALERRIRYARMMLTFERLLPWTAPLLGVAGAYLAISIYGLWPLLPDWLHLLAIVAVTAGIGVAFGRVRHGFHLPTRREAELWLEARNRLPHNPIATLTDRPANLTPEGMRLWKLHQQRIREGLKRVSFPLPQFSLFYRDRWAVGALLLLFLYVGVLSGQGELTMRLRQAFDPALIRELTHPDIAYSAWVEPPEYTKMKPIVLKGGQKEPLKIPRGSVLHVELEEEAWWPRVVLGETVFRFTENNSGVQSLTAEVQAGEAIVLKSLLFTAERWPVEVKTDQPPVIAFAETPEATNRDALRVAVEGGDDYGIVSLKGVIRPDYERSGFGAMSVPGMDKAEITVEIPVSGGKQVQEVSYHDLTEHVLAGLPVTMTLEATDSAGQVTQSEPAHFTMPMIDFTHPVAMELVAQRDFLRLAPGLKHVVARRLWVLERQRHRYEHDIRAYLGMTVGQYRLQRHEGQKPVEEVKSLLWDTATYLEFGVSQNTHEELREALKELKQALADENTTPQQIERMMRNVQELMQQFIREQAERMQRMAEQQPELMMPQTSQQIDSRRLQEALAQAHQLFEAGSREKARDMVSRLQEVMENLMTGQMPQAMPEELKQALEQMERLGELMEEQRRLMEEIAKLQEQGDQDGMRQQGAKQQQELQQQLSDIQKQLGQCMGGSPKQLGDGQNAMQKAMESLKQGQGGPAMEQQQKAMKAMQQAMQEAMQQLMQQYGGGSPGMGGMPYSFGLDALLQEDPFGRSLFGDVEVPDKQQLQRSREILQELYRRSGEYYRPGYERDYIRRLLERF